MGERINDTQLKLIYLEKGVSFDEVKKRMAEKKITFFDNNQNKRWDSKDYFSYTVQDGDTVYSLLNRKLGKISKESFEKLNGKGTYSQTIHPGKELKIPFNEKLLKELGLYAKQQETAPQQQTEEKATSSNKGTTTTQEEKPKQTKIRTTEIKDKKLLASLMGGKVEDLQKQGYFIEDVNGNGVYDNDDKTAREQTVVMLDAGHGGTNPRTGGFDCGTKYEKKWESDITQKAVQFAKERLEKAGYKVVIGKRYHNLNERVREKNKVNPHYFLSFHVNGNDNSRVHGEEVLYRGNNKKFATEIKKSLGKDEQISGHRGLNAGRWKVLSGNPSRTKGQALIELGFLQNPNDRTVLTDDKKLKKQVEASVDGMINFDEN